MDNSHYSDSILVLFRYVMKKEFTTLINKVINRSVELGIVHLTTQDEFLDGRVVTMNGQEYINFGSCNYLGLEKDERLIEAAVDAVRRFGTQLSCARSCISLGQYEELEYLLSEIFEKPALLAPTTSLGHISTLPILVDERDAIILDHQVHNSVKNASQLAKANGTYIETLRHSHMDHLETRIQILRNEYEKVWYMADGIYSIFGDAAPIKQLDYFLNKYEQFHLYIDDAHGMGWTGKHGRGYVLREMDHHPRMLLATSLAKSFANCGGVLVFNDKEQLQLVKNCGSSFLFSGPLQPAVLGASIASAKIHLSDEIQVLQDELEQRMGYFVGLAKSMSIPIVNTELTPIFFVATGKGEVGYKMCKYVMDHGYYCHLAAFPAVPAKNSGLRITITRHQTYEDIKGLMEVIAEGMPIILKEENYSLEEIYDAFYMIHPNAKSAQTEDKSKLHLKIND
jgi:7-keto-8-aminopelargonate synthetase-like enzyme